MWYEDVSSLPSTIYGEDDVRTARGFFADLFREAELAPDPPNPSDKSPNLVCLNWWSSGLGPLTQTIYLARTLFRLRRNVTRRSVPIFRGKVRELLKLRGASLEELLAELRIGAMLTERFSPIALEPMVPEELIASPAVPRSPDFGIRLPDGDVFLEATVLRIDPLDKQGKALSELRRRLLASLKRTGRFGRLHLSVGFSVSHQDVSHIVQAVSAYLSAPPANTLADRRLDIAGIGDVQISWQPIPHFDSLAELERSGTYRGIATFGAGGSQARAVECAVEPSVLRQFEPQMAKSLRNTLNGKRRQAPNGGRYCVILALGNHLLSGDGILARVESELVRSQNFHFLSAVGVFRPRCNFESHPDGERLSFALNPNAKSAVGKPFEAAIAGPGCHLP